VDRRAFLRVGAGGAGLLVVGASGCTEPPAFSAPGNGTPFSSGVLSGLHSPSEVVLWTRLDPDLVDGVTSIDWSVATDPTMTTVVASGSTAIGPARDHTAKVLVGGLDPDRSYHYRFALPGGGASPVGRARTLPDPASSPTRIQLAYGSCQNWTQGWYNAWDAIAVEVVDAVLWLGDYIYESAGTLPGRSVRRDMVGTAKDLAGYRAKYRMVRSDPALQAAHRSHPFVPVWDDHEFRNNVSRIDGINEAARRSAAYQAWFEYMPVWPIDGTRIYRSLRFGRLAEIFMLDTRQYRDTQAGGGASSLIGSGDTVAEAAQPGRTILGLPQRDWLLGGLSGAQSESVRWKLVGNQVMISPVRPIDLDTPELRRLDPNLTRHAGVYLNMDSWDSYFDERDRVLAHLADQRIGNVSFLTGDIHTFWQSTLRADYDDATSPLVANEFVGGSITSSAVNVLGTGAATQIEQLVTGRWDPAFRYVDFRRNGYGIVDCTPETMTVSYRTTDVLVRGTPTITSVDFTLADGDPTPR